MDASLTPRAKDRSVAAGAPEGPLPSVLEVGEQRHLHGPAT